MIKNLVWKLFGQKYLLGGAMALYKTLEGKKTLLATIGVAVVYAAKVLGYIPADLADQLIALLGGMGAVSTAEKFKRWDEELKLTERAGELRKEAMEQLAKDKVI